MCVTQHARCASTLSAEFSWSLPVVEFADNHLFEVMFYVTREVFVLQKPEKFTVLLFCCFALQCIKYVKARKRKCGSWLLKVGIFV